MLIRARRGFTLLEMIVATAIVALLGAGVFMTMASYQRTTKVRDSYNVLQDVAGKLHLYDSLIGTSTVGARNATIGKYPEMLSHLTNAIVAGATDCVGNCMTSCGLGMTGTSRTTYGYSSVHVSAWNAKGPFDSRKVIVGRGFPIGIGLVRDTLVRTPAQTGSTATTTEPGLLQIRIDSVLAEDATEFERIVDGQPTNASAGTVRWTGFAGTDGRQTIFWSMRVRGC